MKKLILCCVLTSACFAQEEIAMAKCTRHVNETEEEKEDRIQEENQEPTTEEYSDGSDEEGPGIVSPPGM